MKLAVIDPVGIKAGMNCYDLGLLNAIREEDVEAYCFSNFIDESYPAIYQRSFFLFEKKNRWISLLYFIYGNIRAQFVCRQRKVSWVLFHVFSATIIGNFAFRLAKLFGRKIIAVVHDVESLSNEDKSSHRQKMYELADILVVHNQTSRNTLLPLLNKENRRKLRTIPHGNYLDFIAEGGRRQDILLPLSFEQGYIYLLFFGQIKPVKGLDVLLKAFASLPDRYRLIIAGRPHRDDFSRYQRLMDELDIADRVIKIIRFITDEERDYLFKRSNALILPYRKIFQSGVLLMAMSYGLPVIASDLPANKELIRSGYNGILFADGDSKELAVKTEQLFSNGMVESMKDHILSSVQEEHSWKKIAKKYLEVLKN